MYYIKSFKEKQREKEENKKELERLLTEQKILLERMSKENEKAKRKTDDPKLIKMIDEQDENIKRWLEHYKAVVK